MAESTETPKPPTPQKIAYEYIKSNDFRVVHADGVLGGPTPQGMLFFSLFSERAPIPQRVVHLVEPVRSEGAGEQHFKLGPELRDERVQRQSLVREVEVGVVISFDNAKALRDWLTQRLDGKDEALGDR